jgi:hypothetical protein
MSGRGDHADLTTRHIQHGIRGQCLRTRPVQRQHRGAGQLGEARRALAVIGVAVGEQDAGHPPVTGGGQIRDPAQVSLVVRTRIYHDRGR